MKKRGRLGSALVMVVETHVSVHRSGTNCE